jgi:tRNA(Arg) A34 adenosine deaminase TadA
MAYPDVVLHLPEWVGEVCRDHPGPLTTAEARMALAVDLARASADQGGGPFGAAVFDAAGRLLAPGANLVVPAGCSVFHAEMVALMVAEKSLGSHDLTAAGPVTLTSSAEPCAQCFGALPWAGVAALECGARSADAEAAGFDEGSKPEDWPGALESRGIRVSRDVARADAAAVIQGYVAGGGAVY